MGNEDPEPLLSCVNLDVTNFLVLPECLVLHPPKLFPINVIAVHVDVDDSLPGESPAVLEISHHGLFHCIRDGCLRHPESVFPAVDVEVFHAPPHHVHYHPKVFGIHVWVEGQFHFRFPLFSLRDTQSFKSSCPWV